MKQWALLRKYRNAYGNGIRVILSLLLHKRNIHVILKSGQKYLWTENEVITYATCGNPDISIDIRDFLDYYAMRTNALKFRYLGKELKLSGIREGTGSISEVFGSKVYGYLEAKGSVIIDIGANIADSSIYFALNGATRVIALEPYPFVYSVASKNIEVNGLSDKVTLLNAGYGSGDSEIMVDDKTMTDGGTTLLRVNNGKTIQVISLKTLVQLFGFHENLALKMDCEGCEYGLIEEDSQILKLFKQIQIEYHYGYKEIKSKLEREGFVVKITKPKKGKGEHNGEKKEFQIGYLYANRLNG